MSSPKISIVIATYNAEKTLDACLDSLKAQSFRDFEILVADGQSKDGTSGILDRRRSEIAVLVSEKDRGIYDAWNKVIPRARGEWIYFLGADDMLWDEQVLERVAPTLNDARENVVYGKVAILLPDGSILNFEGEPWEKVSAKFRHEMTIPHQGTFHRRELFAKYGLFDPEFRICGDYEFLLRELKSHPARFIPDRVIAKMGFGGASSTMKNVGRIIDELARAQKMNGYAAPSVYVTFRRIRHASRRALTTLFGSRFSDRIADVYRRLTGKPRLWTRFHD